MPGAEAARCLRRHRRAHAAALSRELLALLPKLTPAPADGTTTGTGFIDRLQAGAARLRPHRAHRRCRQRQQRRRCLARYRGARSNDIAAARRELLTLPPADRAAVQPWLDKVDARDAALAASRQFAADAMAALSKPAP